MSTRPIHALLALLAAAALTLTGLIGAAATAQTGTSADPTARAASPNTVITLKVVRCNGCIIRPVWYPAATEPENYWEGPAKAVRNGVVRFTVTKEHTVGLAFRIKDPRAVRDKGRTVIVIRYDGQRPGRNVTQTTARRATVGWSCYGGTTRTAITLGVTVDRFASRDYYTGKRGQQIRAYADPTARFYQLGYPRALRSGSATTFEGLACGR